MNPSEEPAKTAKSAHAEREEKVLAFWKEKGIFEKTLAKPSPKGEFVFYEGPPTANGHPGIHHLEARAFKDAIPRYRTMQGYHVRRKGGWDTHGLPVELQVEKEIGLKSKKEIDVYGIGAFNEKCKESVWRYVHEWEDFTNRMGYWVDLKDPYITYKPQYIESVWNVIKTADSKKLLYKDYKVVPWCPRCGTGLSSHELAQGYETVKDLTVYVKFKVKGKENEYLLAWTTTPWTLPGNVALAVGPNITYAKVKVGNDELVLAKERLSVIKEPYTVLGELSGSELVAKGLEYEPLYPFLRDHVSTHDKEKVKNAFKIYPADFVTTVDGTGIVHIAPMYGQDDFELGTRENLPKHHLVHDDGTFNKETGFLGGRFVKDEDVAVDIIKDLANRPSGSLLFAKEKHEHTYPFCWRCKTPLIYFARDSWYIRMSSLRDQLVKGNEGINWEPAHIKEGRFGEWLREIKDWAISRERYWGTPLPVWTCHKCRARRVIGSAAELRQKPKNEYFVMRHGQSENNTVDKLNGTNSTIYHLTELGKKEVRDAAASLKGIDLIISSSIIRAKETAEIIAESIGYAKDKIIIDDRLHEQTFGEIEGKSAQEYTALFADRRDYFTKEVRGIETRGSVKRRVGSFLYDMEKKHEGKKILVVSHAGPIWMLCAAAKGLDIDGTLKLKSRGQELVKNANIAPLDFDVVPHNSEYELDLHRPFIDEVKIACSCGSEMVRAREVIDVWFDSGAMPFAQDHYPFENKKLIDGGIFSKAKGYPADFISEAIDQTRGWFYTLHAIGTLMGKGKAYKNVICLGHILDAQGKKMSKSIGNIVDPQKMMDKYGADALRFWMYSVNQPGDSKNFDEKTVDEVVKKVFNLASNVLSFYKLYDEKEEGRRKKENSGASQNILDQWIIARLDQVIANVTKNMDKYVFLEPTRQIRDFIGDLSQWYLRRSRDRFKAEGREKQEALATTRHVLLTLAKVMAPFTPFFAEYVYSELKAGESVHLESWPVAGRIDEQLLRDMQMVRDVSSKGLEARMKAKLNVRQPLQKLKVKSQISNLSGAFIEVVKDEVNVKEVVFDAGLQSEVELDTNITPALKEEGMVRELMRVIQDMRKEKGLTLNDKVDLKVETNGEGRLFIEKNEKEIMASTSLKAILFSSVSGEPTIIGGLSLKVGL